MSDDGPRTSAQRRSDAEAQLSAPAADAWVATASPEGQEHLVPLSIGWDGERLVLATEDAAVTTRNLRSSGRGRLAVGATRDVVMIDAVLDAIVDVDAAPVAIAETFATQADWDPRGSAGYVFVVLLPRRVQVWREVDEIAGRTVMRDGTWIA